MRMRACLLSPKEGASTLPGGRWTPPSGEFSVQGKKEDNVGSASWLHSTLSRLPWVQKGCQWDMGPGSGRPRPSTHLLSHLALLPFCFTAPWKSLKGADLNQGRKVKNTRFMNLPWLLPKGTPSCKTNLRAWGLLFRTELQKCQLGIMASCRWTKSGPLLEEKIVHFDHKKATRIPEIKG